MREGNNVNKKTIFNYLYNLSYRVIALLVPLVITPYISRVLMADGVGRYAFGAAIVNYFVLFGMIGIVQYGNREIAYVRDDAEALRRNFWEINVLRFITMGISIVAYILYILVFVDKSLYLIYFSLLLTLVASFFDISWFFTGIENFKITAIRNAVVKIAGVFLVFLFVKNSADVWKYAIILSGTTCLGQVIMWNGITKRYSFVIPDKRRLKKHFKATIKLWIPTIAISVYTSLDKVMLGALVDETQVGYYENSQKLVTVVTTVTTTLANVMLPRMSNYYKNGRMKEYKDAIYKCFSLVSFMAFPMAFGIMAVSDSFVPIFFGPGYGPVANLLKISAFLVITLSWSSVFGTQVLVSCGMEKEYTIAVTSGAVINFTLNVFLIRRLQAIGAITASVIAEYVGMLIMAYFVIKHFKIRFRYLLQNIPKYIFATVVMFIVINTIKGMMESNIYSLLVQVIVGIIVYSAVMLITHEENTYMIIGVLNKKILGKKQ